MIYGVDEAKYVQGRIRELGIRDVQLFFDPQMEMWSVCQVTGKSSSLILPQKYTKDIRPSIMFWIKDSMGRRRIPSDQDISDVIALRHRAEYVWDKEKRSPGWLADQLEEADAEKDRKHREAFSDKIKAIAPDMKKAIKRELG